MPILRQNLTSMGNFVMTFNQIWDKVIYALNDVKQIELIGERARTGRARCMST